MDPNCNLDEMLQLAKTISSDGWVPDPQQAERLAELVVALDGWIMKGGFRPTRWSGPSHIASNRPIPDTVTANFKTLQRAMLTERVVLVDCLDTLSGEPVVLICTAGRNQWDGNVEIMPFAKMLEGNPMDRYAPPNPDGGYMLAPDDKPDDKEPTP